MSKFNKIEEIDVWQNGIELVEAVYELTYKNNLFQKDFALRDQIRKSAISIPSNISEGFERESNQEFIRFLFIAKGSCGELRTQLFIAYELKYVSKEDYEKINEKCLIISRKLMNLIKSLRNPIFKTFKH